jgi:hypothetical protein
MTFDEIGELLKKPLNTVKSYHRRALIKFEKCKRRFFSAPKLIFNRIHKYGAKFKRSFNKAKYFPEDPISKDVWNLILKRENRILKLSRGVMEYLGLLPLRGSSLLL